MRKKPSRRRPKANRAPVGSRKDTSKGVNTATTISSTELSSSHVLMNCDLGLRIYHSWCTPLFSAISTEAITTPLSVSRLKSTSTPAESNTSFTPFRAGEPAGLLSTFLRETMASIASATVPVDCSTLVDAFALCHLRIRVDCRPSGLDVSCCSSTALRLGCLCFAEEASSKSASAEEWCSFSSCWEEEWRISSIASTPSAIAHAVRPDKSCVAWPMAAPPKIVAGVWVFASFVGACSRTCNRGLCLPPREGAHL